MRTRARNKSGLSVSSTISRFKMILDGSKPTLPHEEGYIVKPHAMERAATAHKELLASCKSLAGAFQKLEEVISEKKTMAEPSPANKKDTTNSASLPTTEAKDSAIMALFQAAGEVAKHHGGFMALVNQELGGTVQKMFLKLFETATSR
ncbi:hypothetical protein BD410DRAFT_108291 [Rickenella mellea]|uniref:Uncharacterized protein n=1 Tax=Rickenella mellea TaxID=50990 RepID=A0A4Y7PJ25_9AGAM|nr:hypothetical protein BD410DRAFT_108291 [Rickenella mellea]